MPLFLYIKKQLFNFYIYNKDSMAWKLKKEWEGKSIDSIRIPLDDLTQEQIMKLRDNVRNNLFIEEKPKKKKKDVSI
ncbi:MAG: hypothetical protein Unbinned585contig1001_30 [Prokaryotic dsDNA virus sp.]|nr:MAG: hypothetical protein Unbinned585contig1001_30 [Prokaryotic dsDNA virus sp.]